MTLTIDVVLLTKNSMKPCLPECIASLYKNVPVKRLLVIDNNSNDGTIEFLKHFPNVKIVQDSGNRATARQLGIELCETEWFMFLDSDVVLEEGWFQAAEKYIADANIGAIQGATIQNVERNIADFEKVMKTVRKWFGGLTTRTFLEPEQRGYTGDILIKAELVKDIRIPTYLDIFEDHYIKKWIENKGYIFFRAQDMICHHHMENRSPKVSLNGGYIGYKIGYITLKQSILAVMSIIPKIILASYMTSNLKMALWQLKFQLYSFIGVLKAKLTTNVDESVHRVLKFQTGARKEVPKDYKVI